MTKNIIFAGFGGQGVLFMGKVAAYAGMIAGKEITWLPSYGPEMRGGTANCSVIIGDEPIGSPLVNNPNILAVLNQPSYDKFIDSVISKGTIVIDSSLIKSKTDRTDIIAVYIPATELANENDLKGLSNMIVLGKMIKETGISTFETIKKALEKSIPARKADMIAKNIKAIEIGMNY